VASVGSNLDVIGWRLSDAVVVQTPTYQDDLSGYAAFDWTKSSDAVSLTNSS